MGCSLRKVLEMPRVESTGHLKKILFWKSVIGCLNLFLQIQVNYATLRVSFCFVYLEGVSQLSQEVDKRKSY